MNRNLIVPMAADKKEYQQRLPSVFSLGDDGIIVCIKSIMGLKLDQFDNIYFTILKKHDDTYFIADSLRMQCRRLGIPNINIVILDSPTKDQVETLHKTIVQNNITGSIYIKDADCFFESKEATTNGVAVFPIEELEILDPRHKSYVTIDDMFYITNIIEKSVIGRYISAGGYFFESAEEFCSYSDRLRVYGRLYISHVIYAMLLDKKMFRPMMVKKFKDWGTKAMLNLKKNGVY